MLNLLFELRQQQFISDADYFFAKFIADKQQQQNYSEKQKNLAILLAALCQYSLSQGNTCLFLEQALTQNYFDLVYQKTEQDYIKVINQKIDDLPVDQWVEYLNDHIAFTQQPQHKIAPLVFQYGALYFYRSWQNEQGLANYVKSAVQNQQVFPELNQIQQVLNRYFGAEKDKINWQKVAVAVALKQTFCLISGGPGTGKTYTVARLMLSLQELYQGKLHIGLAAPTGKAAARLKESIDKELKGEYLSKIIPNELIKNMPQKAHTLHSLLGIRPFTEQTKYNEKNPLPYDVLIIDEASMIDLSLMSKLHQALSAKSKLILLGDKDQLASVEAGSILGELGQFICLHYDELQQKNITSYSAEFANYLTKVTEQSILANKQPLSSLSDCLCYLPDSRRFSQNSGIGQLAAAINLKGFNAGQKSWLLFQQDFDLGKIEVIEYSDSSLDQDKTKDYLASICQSAVEKYRDYLCYLKQNPNLNKENQELLAILFSKFNSVRFLTALRSNNFGVEQLNYLITEALYSAGLISYRHQSDWYIGKPIMINRNDPNTQLANGDIGICINEKQVCFDIGGEYRIISRSRIPTQFEPAFAMTVHKSQGSEFDHTFLVLPTKANPVLTKELIYTAVTRAKQQFSVFTSELVWKSAVQKQTKRQSGLKFAIEQ